MQPLYNTKVQRPICANSHNDFSINIEMPGLYFSEMPGPCADINTPPPEREIQQTIDLICWLKHQYNIKKIIGHYEVSDSNGKTDPGKSFLYDVLIPRVNSQCP